MRTKKTLCELLKFLMLKKVKHCQSASWAYWVRLIKVGCCTYAERTKQNKRWWVSRVQTSVKTVKTKLKSHCTVVELSTRPNPLIISESLQYRSFWSQSKALFMIRCMLSVESGSKMFGALKVTILCQICWTFSR